MRNICMIAIFLLTVYSCTFSTNSSPKGKKEGLRIVSLAPSVTKEIEELGMADHIVGATSFCDITKKNKDLVIGDAVNVNVEKVLLLNPDIIFTTTLTRKSIIGMFRENGIRIHVIGKQDSFEDVCREFRKIGALTGKEDVAKKIIESTGIRIDSIKKTIPESAKGQKVFIQIGADPLFAVIPNTFMDDYIKFAGCENVTQGFERGTISFETILNRNPDVILIATMGMTAEQEKKHWESFPDLNAVKNGKVFIIDADVACVPTVKNFGKAFENIVKLLVSCHRYNDALRLLPPRSSSSQ